ncbi:MAG: 3-phosphoshikimate 1-carboxyvinyltransferase [Candidatus Eisenbacteria bacterium]|nr:3-phosphoshikimate 1-carboxyvinyltransferase [Candidatus Eisenbacteria bacterium]
MSSSARPAARWGVRRGQPLAGAFAPPGDKSITHRAVLFGLLADGVTRVRGANPGEDCASSATAAAALGATVTPCDGGWDVRGTAGHLRAPQHDIDAGNSGTTLRLLAGIVAPQPFVTRFVGDASLSRRPMRRIAEPLGRMGARLEGQGESLTPPLTVHGGPLTGIDYEVPMASAQVATCTLLAGLAASGRTRVTLPGPARDHTERMLPAFGVALERHELSHGGRRVIVQGGARLVATDVDVPGDFSSAAFFLAAAAMTPGAEVTARGVNLNPTRTGLLDVLAAMGAHVSIANERDAAGEPAGDVTVRGPERLAPFTVPAEWLPRMVDEAPAWVLLASAAEGTSQLTGAGELRVKESDRIASLAAGLRAVGIEAHESPDGLAVTGGTPRGGARIVTHHDHRIAMAFAVLGTRCSEPVWFDDLASVPTSYPAFFETLAELGGALVPEDAA